MHLQHTLPLLSLSVHGAREKVVDFLPGSLAKLAQVRAQVQVCRALGMMGSGGWSVSVSASKERVEGW